MQWSQTMASHSTTFSHKQASVISSPSFRACSKSNSALLCPFVYRSALFGTSISSKISRSLSSHNLISRSQTLSRACCARLDEFPEDEFSNQIERLAQRFKCYNNGGGGSDNDTSNAISKFFSNSMHVEAKNCTYKGSANSFSPSKFDVLEPPLDWHGKKDEIWLSIERKVNSVEIPLSLRIIKKKLQLERGLREAGEFGYCSVKKAFSSMVFMVQELQSCALQMREILLYEDLQEILTHVQKDLNASFVWLFQKVFSGTPTLMVYVMILLANFTVYSMHDNAAIAASTLQRISHAATTETVSAVETENQQPLKVDFSKLRKFSVTPSSGVVGRTSVGGINGGGGKLRLAASGAEGEDENFGTSSQSIQYPEELCRVSPYGIKKLSREEEVSLWNSLVEEASRMIAESTDEILDHQTMQQFVSPVSVGLESDDYVDYFKTELLYQMGLSQEPQNPLLLSNYAQFLFLVAHDHDRAEECFRRSIQLEPPDAEVLSRYANFLWIVREDFWAAEEIYQLAIAADPNNPYHASSYAFFLWNTGGEDTCFPLNTSHGDSKV